MENLIFLFSLTNKEQPELMYKNAYVEIKTNEFEFR